MLLFKKIPAGEYHEEVSIIENFLLRGGIALYGQDVIRGGIPMR
jgi:hypothetical protein